jgi:ketosteroid isomerase-like protein
MKRAVATAFMAVFLIAMTFAQDAGKNSSAKGAGTDEVNKLEKQVRDSLVKGDTSVLERVTADDFVMIDGDGAVFDKNQSLQMMKDGSVKITAINVKDEKLRRYGDTVIYNGLGDVTVSVNGQEHTVAQRVTIVWARQNGQWKRVSFHETPVRPEAK